MWNSFFFPAVVGNGIWFLVLQGEGDSISDPYHGARTAGGAISTGPGLHFGAFLELHTHTIDFLMPHTTLQSSLL